MATQNPFSPAREVAKVFEKDSGLRNRLKNDPNPMDVIYEVTDKVEKEYEKTNDPILYRVAISVLGILAIVTAVGALALTFIDKETPEVLVSLGSAAVGALVGLFAPTPTNSRPA
jgi:hypothetical protein